MLSLHDRITSGGGSSSPLVPVANTDSCSAALPEIGGALGGGVSRDVLVEAAGGTVIVRLGAEAVVHGKTLAAVAIPAAKIAQSATTMTGGLNCAVTASPASNRTRGGRAQFLAQRETLVNEKITHELAP